MKSGWRGIWQLRPMNERGDLEEPEETIVSFVVEESDRRLDKVVRDRLPELSRTQGQRLIEAGDVTVDGQTRKSAYRVEAGESVRVVMPVPEVEGPPRAQEIPLDIIYEDPHLLAVNKPAGMVVHPAPGHPDGTLVNAVLAHDSRIGEVGPPDRAGIVHRLDKETSGVIVVAKQVSVLDSLQEQFRNRQVDKVYVALVHGSLQPSDGIIEVPIGRHPQDRQRMAPLAGGSYARTRYHTVERLGDYTLIEAHPYTGRTHQIRVHLSWLGHPVVGDQVYGRARHHLLQHRHFLHAWKIRFVHPVSGEELSLEAPVPRELTDLLECMR